MRGHLQESTALALRNGPQVIIEQNVWWARGPVCIFRTRESFLTPAVANLGSSSTPWPNRTFREIRERIYENLQKYL
jgi:hypothetical protein